MPGKLLPCVLVLRGWIVHTIACSTLVAGECLQQQSDGQTWLNMWFTQALTVGRSSAIHQVLEMVSTSTFTQRFREQSLPWIGPCDRSSGTDTWVGCLPWHPQAVMHHACSKCILIADVQKRTEKMGSSITIYPNCTLKPTKQRKTNLQVFISSLCFLVCTIVLINSAQNDVAYKISVHLPHHTGTLFTDIIKSTNLKSILHSSILSILYHNC